MAGEMRNRGWWGGMMMAVCLSCGDSGSSHPTVEEAMQEFVPAMCSRLRECGGATFDYDACVDVFMSTIPESDRDALDACTNDELDTCVADVNSMTCPPSLDQLVEALPSTCEKC